MAFQKGARTALKYIIHAPAKERQPQRRLPISIFLTELGIRGNDLNNLDVYVLYLKCLCQLRRDNIFRRALPTQR